MAGQKRTIKVRKAKPGEVIDGQAVLLDDQGRVADFDWPDVPGYIKIRRRAFLLEYIKDFVGYKAAMRCGQSENYLAAVNNSCNWLREPYTQWLLAKLVRDSEDTKIISRSQIVLGLVQLAYTAEDEAVRLRAFETLAKINGMFILKIETSEGTNNGGVMRLPSITTLDEWEKQSQLQQKRLKTEAAREAA